MNKEQSSEEENSPQTVSLIPDANAVKLIHDRLTQALEDTAVKLEYIETTMSELKNIEEGMTWILLGLQRQLLIEGLELLKRQEEERLEKLQPGIDEAEAFLTNKNHNF